MKAVARTSSSTPNSTHKRPPPQPLSVSWNQGFICVHCQALKPQTSECLALTRPSHKSVYPPVNFGRFMQHCVLLLTTTGWCKVLTDTTASPESSPIHTSQSPVIMSTSHQIGSVHLPDYLQRLRPNTQSHVCSMFLDLMLPQTRFVRFRLATPHLMQRFYVTTMGLKLHHTQALTSWPNRSASPPWN